MPQANFTDIPAGKIKRADVNDRLNALKTATNNVDATQIAASGVGASEHADMNGTTDIKHSGTSVKIFDTAGHFSSGTKNAETILAEIAVATGIGGGGGALGAIKLLGYKEGGDSVDTVVVPADAVDNKIYVIAWAYGRVDTVTNGAMRTDKYLQHLIEDSAYADSGFVIAYGGSSDGNAAAAGGTSSNIMEITPTTAKSTTIRWKAGQTDTIPGGGTGFWENFKMIVIGY